MAPNPQPKLVSIIGTDSNRRITYGINKTLEKQANYFKIVEEQRKPRYKRAKGQSNDTIILADGLDVDIVQAYIFFAERQEVNHTQVFTISAHNTANPSSAVVPTMKTCVNFYYTACKMQLRPDLGRTLLRSNILTPCTSVDSVLSASDICHIIKTIFPVDKDFVFCVARNAIEKHKLGKYNSKEGARQWADVVTFVQLGEFGEGLTRLIESTVRPGFKKDKGEKGGKVGESAVVRPASSWD